MAIALRILQLVLVAVLVLAATGTASMASAAIDEPCCDDEQGGADSAAPDDCSPFCFSCPSRTLAPVATAVAPAPVVTIERAAIPALAFVMASDPPRRGVFHPPRLSVSGSRHAPR